MTSPDKDQIVTYAHNQAPDGQRFVGTADAIPSWAVNVEYDDGTPKNWLGLPHHPTDQYIHFKDKEPVEKMNELRKAYDQFIALGFLKELKFLLDEAYSAGRCDESDANNPDL